MLLVVGLHVLKGNIIEDKDILYAPLAEALALDARSEEEDDEDQLTLEQLQEILEGGEEEETPQPDMENERVDFTWTEDYSSFAGVREQFV